jgi:glycosyltransferase involved in cell wall biosynthesis
VQELRVLANPTEPRKADHSGFGCDDHPGRILSGPVRIVMDVSPLSLPRTGIGNYVRGMVTGLAEAAGDRHELIAFAPSGPRGRRRIQQSLAGLPVQLRLPVLPKAQVWRSSWSRLGRPPVETVVGPLDVFHFSDWMYPPQRGGVRATTVHDLVPLRFPEWVQSRTRRMHGPKYENAARTCDRVFVNSEFTGCEVAELLGVQEERIVVAYPGIDPRFRPDGEHADLGGPYILAVSTLEPRKNLPALVAAFARLRRPRPELTLAIAGLAGWEEQPLHAAGVRLLGFVPDEELARLYRGAAVFAYPSRFEGFGLPVAEAMACGTPAVVSSHASLDEASGESAFRADPNDAEAFAQALELALDTPSEQRERGIAHAERFTWRSCGEAVLAGYESALTN